MISKPPLGLRQDIQQLRAIAVLAVIVNHLGITWLPGGYLGVDMFFVVSGFVITNSMLSGESEPISRLRFFGRFWIRRVFRLWPMLFVTVLGTTALLIITGLAQPGPLLTGLSSLLGISNFRLLFGRLDYFALDTGDDWFMHTWSLAVEEQVYVLLSLIFVLFGGARVRASRRSLRSITAAIATLSIASLAFAFAPFTTELVRFYAPHTRLYQICTGALLALATVHTTSSKSFDSRRRTALVLLALIGITGLFATYIGAGALGSLSSTALTVIILASTNQRQRTSGFLPLRWLGGIGDRSYALYLVHWPAQLLAENLVNNTVGRILFSLGLTFVFGFAGYRLVENPTRHRWRGLPGRRAVGFALAGLITTFGVTIISYQWVDRSQSPVAEIAIPTETCNQENSSIRVIGDSHLGAIRHEIAQAFESNCAEVGGYGTIIDFVDLARSASGQRSIRVKLIPLQRITELIRSADNPPSALIVVHFLSGFMSDPEAAPASADFVATEWEGPTGEGVSRTEFLNIFENYLESLSEIMADSGSALIVTSPPPDFNWLSVDIDPALCRSRLVTSRECALSRTEATISREDHNARGGEIRTLLSRVQARHKNFVHLSLDSPFCNQRECSNFKNGKPAYRDDDHLNFAGAEMISPFFQNLRIQLQPDGPGKLVCESGQSVFLCRIEVKGRIAGQYRFAPKFVGVSVSTKLINRVDHVDDFGTRYCVSLWASDEATFVAGECG